LQIKWLAWAAAVVCVTTGSLGAGFLALGWVPGTPGWVVVATGAVLAYLCLPVAVGFAILRYRLYEIDRIINLTLVYGALTVVLGLAYWGGVALLQSLLRPVTGGSDLAIVGSTLLVAAAFLPVRRWIQASVDRRFYRARYDAQLTLAEFSTRLRAEVDLDGLAADLRDVVHQTMAPAHLSLWLRRNPDAAHHRR